MTRLIRVTAELGLPKTLGQFTDLRSNIVRSATESGRGDSVTDPLLAHSEVCQFTVTLVVQQYIVQFQISERNKEQHEAGSRAANHPPGRAGSRDGGSDQRGHVHPLHKESTSSAYLDEKS